MPDLDGFGRSCFSPTAGLAGRRCCRFRRTGSRGRRSWLIWLRTGCGLGSLARSVILPRARVAIRGVLPQRLADRWLGLNPPSAWTNQGLAEAESALHHWSVFPSGTEGYEKAEVTAGGVDTAELNGALWRAARFRGFTSSGEVVDVTGQLGGFNFQWAWASGAAAGRALGGELQFDVSCLNICGAPFPHATAGCTETLDFLRSQR